MRRAIFTLLLLFTLCIASAAQEADYIVGLKQEMPRRGQVKKEFPNLKAYHTKLSKKDADELRKDKRVSYVEENRQMKLNDVQADAGWNLARIDQRQPLGVPPDTSYTYNSTGEGVIVYIIDTGVWLENPEFEGRATAAMGDHTEISTCADGHGTHVAGIVASRTYGVAKRARIVSLRLNSCAEPGLEVYKLLEALEWIAAQKISKNEARVANISMTGAGRSSAVDNAINVIRSKKVFVAVAAGNSNGDACSYFPAGTPSAFTVGASWAEDERALYSNYGSCVDIFAPGHQVISTWNRPPQMTNELSGTSMASPHVAGAAALYLQNHRRDSAAEIESAILTNATQNVLANVGAGSPNSLLYTLFF